MQHPMTDHDQSAYADSIRRLTIAMRGMLGMGPAADIVSKNEAPPVEGTTLHQIAAGVHDPGVSEVPRPSV
jgi:hypothetical protein